MTKPVVDNTGETPERTYPPVSQEPELQPLISLNLKL